MKSGSVCSLALLLTLVSPCLALGDENEPSSPCVVGFTFQNGYSFDNLPTKQALDAFNAGALDGFGVSYEKFKKGPTPDDLKTQIAFLNAGTRPGKHIWPVVFIVKMLQFVPGKVHGSWGVNADMRAQSNIPGMDLENETGARDVFEDQWRNALLIANALHSPGIMFDAEFYFGGLGDIQDLAQRRSEDVDTAAAKCEAFGARLADITEKTFPDASVFWFFTGLHEPKDKWGPVQYICLGALKRAKEIHSRQLHLDGGEGGVGYLHRSLDALNARIHNRWIETRDILLDYPNFQLAGVLAPYVDIRSRASWMTFDRIDPRVKTAADFEPWFQTLFSNYRYTWLYGASGGSPQTTAFNPWDPAQDAAMSVPIAKAKKEAAYAPPDLAKLDTKKLPEGDSFDSLDYAQLARKVWVDLAHPAPAKIVAHYWRGQSQDPNAATGEGAKVIPESVEAAGKTWSAQIAFDGNKVSKWPWPAVSITNLPLKDISRYKGMAVEVYNPSDKPLYFRFALFTPDSYPNDQWGCLNETIPPKSSHLFSFTDVTKPVSAISFAAVQQPDPLMRVYVSPLYLISR